MRNLPPGRWYQTDDGVIIFYPDPVAINTDSGDTVTATLTVKRDVGQTANLQEWWDESAAVLARVLENGQIEANGYAEDVKTIVVPGGGSTYIATDEQSIFLYDISAGDGVLTLPKPSLLPLGRKYKVKLINTSTAGVIRTLTINSASGNVEFAASFTMGVLYQAITLHHNGTDWFVWPLTPDVGNNRLITASGAVSPYDGFLLVSTAAGDVALSMPVFATVPDKWEVTIKKSTSDANEININTGGIDKIDGITTYDILSTYESVTIHKANGQWWVK